MDRLNILLDTLNKKKNKMNKILEITRLQTTAIDLEEDENLNKYINDKQILIKEIDLLDLEFQKTFDDIKKGLGIKSFDEVDVGKYQEFKKIKIELNEIHEIIDTIVPIEKENSIKIKTEYNDIKLKIKGINDNKMATSAYANINSLTDAAFFDKKK